MIRNDEDGLVTLWLLICVPNTNHINYELRTVEFLQLSCELHIYVFVLINTYEYAFVCSLYVADM